MKQEMIERFFEFVNERHMIYIRKEIDKEPWPWTDDPILREYKFTNVFRELDKGTIWLRENWLEPFAWNNRLYFNIAMYRQFNWPQTMDLVGYVMDVESFNVYQQADLLGADTPDFSKLTVWSPQYLTERVEHFQNAGNKVFTGAYMIRGQCINPTGRAWTSKAQYMFHQVLDPVWKAPEPNWQSMTLQEAWQWWQQFEGFGPFLGYEIVTDMRHTRYLKDAPDIMIWANAGPGAMRGIHRLMGWEAKHKQLKQEWYNQQMQVLLALSPKYLEDHVPALEMRDIEHVSCEFDKYERVRTGEGRPRSKYKPPQV